MRGLTVEEHAFLSGAVRTCSGRPGASDDRRSYTAAEERIAARLVVRSLVREYACTCGWSHYGVTSNGRLALSIYEQIVALHGKAA